MMAQDPGVTDAVQTAEIILGLGSNQGDRVRNLERAVALLSRDVSLDRVSSIYETEPVGMHDQPWFLNLVCMGYARMSPRGLLECAREIESALGRRRGLRFGPRTIDVDILAYGDEVIDERDLEIPHPRMTERRFVLEPLCEIAPDWRHPVDGRTARQLLDELTTDESVRPYGPPPNPAAPPPIA